MSNNENNPNYPYHLQSTWNPFSGLQQSSNPPSTPTSSNPQMPGFASYAQMSQVPQTQFTPYNQPPPFNNPQPQIPYMSPEEMAQFQMWRQSQQQPDVQSVEETNPTPKRGKSKGKKAASPAKQKKTVPNRNNWEPQDELRLAESWISVSENSNRGIDQSGPSFWYLVMDSYNARNPPFIRGKDALSSKWTKLNADCQKWGGIWNRLKAQPRSGEGSEDFMVRCENQFRLENENRNFVHFMAWNYLKDKQKWLHPEPFVVGRRNVPKRRETINLEEVDLDEEPEEAGDPTADLFGPDRFPRPVGKSRKSKSQKTSSGSAGSSRASFDESLTSTFEGIRGDKRNYYQTKDLEAKLRIVSMPTEGLPEQARIILEMEKMKICQSMGWPYGTGGGSGASGSGAGDI